MKPSTTSKSFSSLLVLAGLALSFSPVNAATVIFSDNFEAGLGNWSVSGGAALYTYDGVAAHNYASGGTGAVNLPKSGGTMILINPIALLNTSEDDFVTISLDWQRQNATTTRFLTVDYSSDGSNFTQLARHATGTNQSTFSGSVTLTRNSLGVVSHAVGGVLSKQNNGAALSFTNDSIFRIVDTSSAGADVRSYVDNVIITSSIPEPSTALLGGIGALFFMRRRRA